MIHKDSGLVSSQAGTGGVIAPLLRFIVFFPSPYPSTSLSRCAGIQLFTIKLECISSQMLGET